MLFFCLEKGLCNSLIFTLIQTCKKANGSVLGFRQEKNCFAAPEINFTAPEINFIPHEIGFTDGKINFTHGEINFIHDEIDFTDDEIGFTPREIDFIAFSLYIAGD